MRVKLILLLLFGFAFGMITARADDGIPDNCEFGSAEQAKLFARYEPQNHRLMLVDWTTGEDVRMIAGSLDSTIILGWSPDCRYLAGAVGSSASMDTVVWEVSTSTEIGSVADAHQQPHTITWGPGDYLVVETRNGAILWNVPANTQTVLTTAFNNYTARNFSRLRWDAANNQLIVNLAVGGRAAYDLTTGAEVPVAASATPSSENANGVVIGGKFYACQTSSYYSSSNIYSTNSLTVRYHPTEGTIDIAHDPAGAPPEVVQMVENNVDASWFQFRGWSANCHYFVASVGIPGRDASDTVAWDVEANRRVGVFADAHDIPHPIHWGTAGDSLVIETRDGAYLWNLSTDARTLLTDTVETASSGRKGIKSFERLGWGSNGRMLFAVEVGHPDVVIGYDAETGAQVGRYTLDDSGRYVYFTPSADSRLIVLYGSTRPVGSPALVVWDVSSGARWALHVGDPSGYSVYSVAISPDNRFVAIMRNYRVLEVWDLQHPTSDGLPNYHYADVPFSSPKFIDNVTVGSSYSYSSTSTINVITGEVSVEAPQQAPSGESLDGMSGYGASSYFYGWGYYPRTTTCENGNPEYNSDTRQMTMRSGTDVRVLESDVNNVQWSIDVSPGCRYIAAEVSVISNADLPYDTAPLDDDYAARANDTLVIWDVATGERLAELPQPYGSAYSSVIWSPDGERAFITTNAAHFLWSRSGGAVVLTSPFASTRASEINSYPKVYWDYSRSQTIISGWGGAMAFDMNTGVLRSFFPTDPADQSSGYYRWGSTFSIDGNYLFVTGGSTVSIWNMDTLEHYFIDVDPAGGSRVGNYAAISPDGHTFVMAFGMLRVWDLTSLPEDFNQRDPVARFNGPPRYVYKIHFVDNDVVETTSGNGYVSRWNIHTGEQVD